MILYFVRAVLAQSLVSAGAECQDEMFGLLAQAGAGRDLDVLVPLDDLEL